MTRADAACVPTALLSAGAAGSLGGWNWKGSSRRRRIVLLLWAGIVEGMELEIDFGSVQNPLHVLSSISGLKLGPAVLCSSAELGTFGQPHLKDGASDNILYKRLFGM